MENKNNQGLIILIVILSLLVIAFGGYFVYDKFIADNKVEEKENSNNTDTNNNNDNQTNNNNNNTDTNNNNDNQTNNNNNNTDTNNNNNQTNHVGRYLSVDGDPNTAYIELYSNNKYKLNRNNCSEIVIIEGNYSLSVTNGITTIAFTSAIDEYGHASDPIYSFTYKDGKLSIIDATNTYAYYDCTNSRTFQKQ